MNAIDLKEILLEELDYASSPGFVSSISWLNDRPISDISSAYFIGDVPIIYFSQLEEVTPIRLWELYRKVWNQSKVPLLYVISRHDIWIYNSYAEPARTADELIRIDKDHSERLLQHLQELYDIETARQEIRSKLNSYRRLYVDTGAFWSTADGQLIRREKRADQRLLRAMDQVRRRLLNEKLSPELAYALLGRSIFIRYLEDRAILTKTWVSQITGGQAQDYLSALTDKHVTYRLFDYLSQRFNGDLFPVDEESEERQQITQNHLNYLSDFLKGYDLDTGQLSFWPYDFTHIPVELISGIYDTFLST